MFFFIHKVFKVSFFALIFIFSIIRSENSFAVTPVTPTSPPRYLPYRELILNQPVTKDALFAGLNDGSSAVPVPTKNGPPVSGAYYISGGKASWAFSSSDDSYAFSTNAIMMAPDQYGINILYNGFSSSIKSLNDLLTNYPKLCSLATVANTTTVIGNRIICTLTLQDNVVKTNQIKLPLVVKDPSALFTKSVQTMINASPNGPNPFVINYKSPIQLGGFFNLPTQPNTQLTYTLDSSNVCDSNDPLVSSSSVGVGSQQRSRRSLDYVNQTSAIGCGGATGVVALPNTPGGKVLYPSNFVIQADGTLVVPNVASGMYQVNIKATAIGKDVLGNQSTQFAFQTIYLNVGGVDNNYFYSGVMPLSLLYTYNGQKWSKGGVSPFNPPGQCPTLAQLSPSNNTYPQTVTRQSADLTTINQIFGRNGTNYSMKLATSVGTQLEYQSCAATEDATQCNFWSTPQLNTPYDQLTSGSYSPLNSILGGVAQITFPAGTGNLDLALQDQASVCAYSDVFSTASSPLKGLLLDFEQPQASGIMAGKALSGEFVSQNDTENQILAASYVKQLFNRPTYVGASLDFEAGFANDQYFTWLKNLTDRLAFRGQMLADYDFANRAFVPGVVAALGATGMAIFSAYDVVDDRAPIAKSDNVAAWGQAVWYNNDDITVGGLTLNKQGLTSAQQSLYATMMAPPLSSVIALSPGIIPPAPVYTNCAPYDSAGGYLSGGTLIKHPCGDSIYDSWSEGIKKWAGAAVQLPSTDTAYDIFKKYGGRFVPVLPIAQSGSQSPYYLIPNPSLTFATPPNAAPAVVLSNVTTQPKTYQDIETALGKSAAGVVTSSSSVPFQSFFGCPGITDSTIFTSCLIVSAPVVFHNTANSGSGYRYPSIEDWLQLDTAVYEYYSPNNKSSASGPGSLPVSPVVNPSMIGVAFFGLGDATSEESHGCNNPTSGAAANTDCFEPWYIGFQTQPYDSQTPAVDPFYTYYQNNTSDPAAKSNGLSNKYYTPLVDNYNTWRVANNLLSTYAQQKGLTNGPTAYDTVSWTNRGLPITPFSSNGGNMTATITTDAKLATKYTCWVISHSQPSRTCSVNQVSTNQANLILSSPSGSIQDYDYAVFVRASAGTNAIYADSVYINIPRQ